MTAVLRALRRRAVKRALKAKKACHAERMALAKAAAMESESVAERCQVASVDLETLRVPVRR